MNTQELSDFKHKAAHQLMALNEKSGELYQISKWPRWDYDLDEATLTFSRDGIPQVIASVQVVGTTSKRGKTWLCAWANSYLPAAAVNQIQKSETLARLRGLPISRIDRPRTTSIWDGKCDVRKNCARVSFESARGNRQSHLALTVAEAVRYAQKLS
jgi:hypothetical protein